MKFIKNNICKVAFLLMAFGIAPANASLIGQDVNVALISVEEGSDVIDFIADDTFTNPLTVTVIEGEPEIVGFIGGLVNVDIEAETLGILFPAGIIINDIAVSLNEALALGPLDFIGLLFADLSWGTDNPGQVVGITNVQSNIIGFTDTNVLFDGSNVAFNILDLAIDAGSFVIVDLLVEHDAEQVPVTGTFILFGLALVGMRLKNKR